MIQNTDEDAGTRLRAVTGMPGILLMAVMLSGPPLMALVFSTIAPILPSIAAHFRSESGGTMLAQWIMTTPAIGLMLGGPLGGLLIDRIGVRRLLIWAFLLFAIGGSAGLYVESPWLLLLSRFVLGFSGACVATGATWLIGARFDEQARHKLIGAQDAIAGLSAMSAVLLAGWVAASGGWRAPFAIYLLALPLFFCALFVVPAIEAAAKRNGRAAAVDASGGGRALLPLWPLYVGIVCIAGLMMMPSTQVPFVMAANGTEDPIIRSRVIASSAMMAIVGSALFPFVRRWLGERGTLVLILLFYAAGTATIGLSRDALGTALGCAFLGSGTGLFMPHFASAIIARTEPLVRGRALGLMLGAVFLSEFLSPLVILPLRHFFGVHGGFMVLAPALIVAAVAVLLRGWTGRRKSVA